MANIKLMRVDSRLIHGQVVTNWVVKKGTNSILIIDDELANDEFMKDIYIMAAPPGIPVRVFTVAEAQAQWQENQFGDCNLLILFKNIQQALKSHEAGIPVDSLQIGGLPSGAGRKVVYKTVSLGQKDYEDLDALQQAGTDVYFQMLPEEEGVKYSKIKR